LEAAVTEAVKKRNMVINLTMEIALNIADWGEKKGFAWRLVCGCDTAFFTLNNINANKE